MAQPGIDSTRVKHHPCRQRHWPGFAGAAVGLLLIAFAAFGCGQRLDAVGRYEAVSQTPEGRIILALELQADGKGFWTVESDSAPFRWDLHKNTIRLHTQTGGVIQGTWDRGNIQVAMPGQADILFTKVR